MVHTMNNIYILYLGDDLKIKTHLDEYFLTLGWQINIISSIDDLKDLTDFKPDILLVDLDEKNNQKLISTYASENQHIVKILLNSSVEQESYLYFRKILPFSYLIKPCSGLELRITIEAAILYLRSDQKKFHIFKTWQEEEELHSSFFIKNNNKLLRVKQSDILAVEADGNYCIIITPQRRHAVKISLRKIKMKLSTLIFRQIHRNYIIQIPKIESVDLSSNEVLMEGDIYPIGGSYRQDFLDCLDRI